MADGGGKTDRRRMGRTAGGGTRHRTCAGAHGLVAVGANSGPQTKNHTHYTAPSRLPGWATWEPPMRDRPGGDGPGVVFPR